MKFKLYSLVAILSLCAIVCGCNKGPKKPADLPTLYPTTAVVTYDNGTPVAGATVTLLAEQSGGRHWNLTGVTDASGSFTFKTDGNWDGAPAGTYNVIVVKEISDVEDPTEVGGSVTVKGITRYVDQKYGNPRTSGITVEVTEGTNNLEIKVGEEIEEDVPVSA
ncbi:MAG: carboxypeptidase-like regulatory domain-containing protein [Thermoguttaceae bacterium]|jgi:hypothetical protein